MGFQARNPPLRLAEVEIASRRDAVQESSLHIRGADLPVLVERLLQRQHEAGPRRIRGVTLPLHLPDVRVHVSTDTEARLRLTRNSSIRRGLPLAIAAVQDPVVRHILPDPVRLRERERSHGRAPATASPLPPRRGASPPRECAARGAPSPKPCPWTSRCCPV